MKLKKYTALALALDAAEDPALAALEDEPDAHPASESSRNTSESNSAVIRQNLCIAHLLCAWDMKILYYIFSCLSMQIEKNSPGRGCFLSLFKLRLV